MIIELEDFQREIVDCKAKDQLAILPRRSGKTLTIIEKIKKPKYETVGVVLPTMNNVLLFRSMLERFFKVEVLNKHSIEMWLHLTDSYGNETNVFLFSASILSKQSLGYRCGVWLDLLVVDEGDYVDSSVLDNFLIYDDLYVVGSLRFASPQLNTCLGYLYYNHLDDFKLFKFSYKDLAFKVIPPFNEI